MQPSAPQPPEPMLPAMPNPPAGAAPLASSMPTQAAPTTPSSGAPELADDGDLIEKEWVAKVKQVLAATAHDPLEQSKQFTELKADYMQKRYGKSIKSED
ncbi:hypothetical protein BH09PAT3_BH09PAT3_2910 [soil metagenome]